MTSVRKLLNAGCGGHFHPEWTNLDLNNTAPGVLQYDLRKGLPFPNEAFDAVYHSHVLEHLAPEEAFFLLKECQRVLRPGGILRVVVPDLENIVRLYLAALDGALAGDREQTERYRWLVIELLDQMVRTQSGGEMLKYWQQATVPAEAFVIERVGQEYLNFRKAYLAAAPARASVATDQEKKGRPPAFADSGELHKWMYDRFSLGTALQAAGFSDPRTCTATESRIAGFSSYFLDSTPDGKVRKPDSLFMEGIKGS